MSEVRWNATFRPDLLTLASPSSIDLTLSLLPDTDLVTDPLNIDLEELFKTANLLSTFIYEHLLTPETRQYLNPKYALTLESTKAYFSEVLSLENFFIFLLQSEASHGTYGYCTVWIPKSFPDLARVSVYLHQAYWGKGIARKALNELEKMAVSSNINTFRAEVRIDNARSQRLVQKLGYTKIKQVSKPTGVYDVYEKRLK